MDSLLHKALVDLRHLRWLAAALGTVHWEANCPLLDVNEEKLQEVGGCSCIGSFSKELSALLDIVRLLLEH